MQAQEYQFNNINDERGDIQSLEYLVTPTIFIIKDGKVESITTGIITPLLYVSQTLVKSVGKIQ